MNSMSSLAANSLSAVVVLLLLLMMPAVAHGAEQEQERDDAKPRAIRGSGGDKQPLQPNSRAGMEPWKTRRLGREPGTDWYWEGWKGESVKKGCAYWDAGTACEAANLLGFTCGSDRAPFETSIAGRSGWGGLYAYPCDSSNPRRAGVAFYNTANPPDNRNPKNGRHRICNYAVKQQELTDQWDDSLEGTAVYLDTPFVARETARTCTKLESFSWPPPPLSFQHIGGVHMPYFYKSEDWLPNVFSFILLNGAMLCRLDPNDSVHCHWQADRSEALGTYHTLDFRRDSASSAFQGMLKFMDRWIGCMILVHRAGGRRHYECICIIDEDEPKYMPLLHFTY